jgi:DNA adenine methylase
MAATKQVARVRAPQVDRAPRETVATPVVKWVGGKTKLLPELLARMPTTFGHYYEPFIGGAAMYFKLAPERAVIADVNPDLIALYRAIARDPNAVIKKLAHHREEHDETHYYATREKWNQSHTQWSAAERAATFIYLNKTCFNGLWRVNRSGGFNVPIGRYIDPPICVPDALRAASKVLARAEIRHADYATAIEDAEAGDFLYFDPPYDPINATSSFTSYTVGDFGVAEQTALAATAKQLIDRGCKVMLSNNDTPLIRSLYKGLKLDKVKCSRAINSNAAKRGEIDELVITGGY